MNWIWVYSQATGEPATFLPEDEVIDSFATQEEAEEYLGRTWQKLYAAGVAGVSLYNGNNLIYGPMSLEPPN